MTALSWGELSSGIVDCFLVVFLGETVIDLGEEEGGHESSGGGNGNALNSIIGTDGRGIHDSKLHYVSRF